MSDDLRPGQTLLIYGGAFDPPHRAHVELPFEIARRIEADRVLFVPTGQPPHKSDASASAADRRAMLRAALAGQPDADISTFELNRPSTSYTVDTLEHLRRTLADGVNMRLLIGADMAAMFYDWRSPQRIIELAEPVVMMRPPYDIDALLRTLPAGLPEAERAAWRSRIVPCEQIDISSTQLREHLAAGDYDSAVVRRTLHPAVVDYIRRRGLYRASNNS